MKTFIRFAVLLLMLIQVSAISAQKFTNFTTSDGLPSNNVLCVTVDASNVKWFGTQDGVARFNDTSWMVYTKSNGLPDNYINCITIDVQNHVWVGTDYGVSTCNGNLWTTYTTANGLISNQITCLAPDPDGSIWIGTNDGVSYFNGTTSKNYTTADGLPVNMISAIKADGKGNTWFGTWLGGLSKFNGSTFKTFTTADSLIDNNISALAIDSQGNIWIGTYIGITLFNSSDQWIANYRAEAGTLSLYVKDLDVDSKGTLWVGIYVDYLQDGGIRKFLSQEWTTYTVADGLVNPQVQKLAADNEDNVWIATGEGVSKLTDQNSGINDSRIDNMTIYPNPSCGHLFLKTGKLPDKITFFDITGKSVLTLASGQIMKKIDIRSLKPGIYFASISVGAIQSVQKVVVQ